MTTTPAELAAHLDEEVARADRELAEIELLVGQAGTEATRHEARRAAAFEKAGSGASPDADGLHQLATLSRRAVLMEAQVEILEAKRKAVIRLRDAAAEHARAVRALIPGGGGETGPGALEPRSAADSRLIEAAIEDLRREIARAMHDGPAQSLTNIVLQAQIVDRLLTRDPGAAPGELAQLVAMVQQTLEATKTFIFDVRPMVLDDLGLVPTLRRAARERGQRAGIAVDFESVGVDRRLPVDIESALFRTLDDALVGVLAAGAERATMRLDWGDELVASVGGSRAPVSLPDPALPDSGDLLPALAEMVERRRRDRAEAVEAARQAAVVPMPAAVLRDAVGRAGTYGYSADVSAEGDRLTLRLALASIPAA